jgi:hypothetical protein
MGLCRFRPLRASTKPSTGGVDAHVVPSVHPAGVLPFAALLAKAIQDVLRRLGALPFLCAASFALPLVIAGAAASVRSWAEDLATVAPLLELRFHLLTDRPKPDRYGRSTLRSTRISK